MAHVTQKQGIVAAVQDTWDRTVMKLVLMDFTESIAAFYAVVYMGNVILWMVAVSAIQVTLEFTVAKVVCWVCLGITVQRGVTVCMVQIVTTPTVSVTVTLDGLGGTVIKLVQH